MHGSWYIILDLQPYLLYSIILQSDSLRNPLLEMEYEVVVDPGLSPDSFTHTLTS